VNKAIVLAAGRGTRMGDLTEQMPKPMLSLAGKPIIEHILDRLRAAGTTEVFIVTGYRAETIERHLRDYPIQVTFRRQDNINGTGTAALLAREFAGPDPVLLTFGDIICESEEYDVTRIVEKPPKGTSTTHWNSAGLYTFRPVIFEHLANLEPSPRGEYELTDAVASLIAAGERVLLYPIRGGWRDVGRPEDLSAAEQLVD
jgi:UDP-N-acetylglucosamine diphosphorylase / glucose-1-phosphate thymidylyltransferase / UDP-N-acetylgalactosamine diphosphorylase / glucosamine-1-phosphate N-acetyltransferase / galactosamine-1-phosphate N-acetyltransferase